MVIQKPTKERVLTELDRISDSIGLLIDWLEAYTEDGDTTDWHITCRNITGKLGQAYESIAAVYPMIDATEGDAEDNDDDG